MNIGNKTYLGIFPVTLLSCTCTLLYYLCIYSVCIYNLSWECFAVIMIIIIYFQNKNEFAKERRDPWIIHHTNFTYIHMIPWYHVIIFPFYSIILVLIFPLQNSSLVWNVLFGSHIIWHTFFSDEEHKFSFCLSELGKCGYCMLCKNIIPI